MRWPEQHVAITGASSGIGSALARELASAGAKLTLVARRESLLSEVNREVGGSCHIEVCDLSDHDAALAWVARAEDALGAIDVLVNNAGMEATGPTVDLDPEMGERLLQLNLHTPLRLMHHLLPRFLERKSGSFVNVASVAALVCPPGQAWYGASKAGLAQFSESLRGELRKSGVHVLTVYPGPVKTAMSEASLAAYGPSKAVSSLPEGTPERLAQLIRRGVERRKARILYPPLYAASYRVPWLGRLLVDAAAPELRRPLGRTPQRP